MNRADIKPKATETLKENSMNDIEQVMENKKGTPETSSPAVQDQAKPKRGRKPTPPIAAPASDKPEVRVLRISTCPSLSGRSTLTYHIGCIDEAVQLRVYQNSGKGYFNQEWVAYSRIKDLLIDQDQLSAGRLRPIFKGKSVNTAGFFMAVLKHLGLIETSKVNPRFYAATKSLAFESAVTQLIASGISVRVDQPVAKAQGNAKVVAS